MRKIKETIFTGFYDSSTYLMEYTSVQTIWIEHHAPCKFYQHQSIILSFPILRFLGFWNFYLLCYHFSNNYISMLQDPNPSSQIKLILAGWLFSSHLIKCVVIESMLIVGVMHENRLPCRVRLIYNSWEITGMNRQNCHNTSPELPQQQSIKEYFVHAQLFISSFSFH